MFQGLRVEAADRSAWKDGLEPSGEESQKLDPGAHA